MIRQMLQKSSNAMPSADRSGTLVTHLDPRAPEAEAYRTLRTNLQFAALDRPLRRLMVTSTGPGEGKTTTIANLAVVFAQADKQVLLVDADLRKPALHHVFRFPNSVGLSSVLVGASTFERAAVPTEVPGLTVLTAGPIPPNPAEMLGSKAMARFLEEVSAQYELVLIDAPPVLAVTDAQVLSRKVDGVLLVVASGQTKRELAQKAKGLLEAVQAPLLGVVLNRRKFDKREGYYYYYAADR